jgi:hypothetical protein
MTQLEKDAKKLKTEVTRNDIRQGLLVLANLKIKNPEYDSQAKTRLTGPDLRKDFVGVMDANWKMLSKVASGWLARVLERANERHHKQANKKAQDDHLKKKRKQVEGLLDASGTNRMLCQVLITEGLCIEENTKIKTITDLGMVGKKLKDVNIGDLVITHKGNLKHITSLTKTMKKGVKITTSADILISSKEHKYLVYNKKTQTFDWIPVFNIDKHQHQLVRSRLGEFIGCDKFELILNQGVDNKQFPYIIQTNEETIKSSATHTFIVLNIDTESIDEIACEKLNQDIHWLLLFSSEK